MEIAAPGEAKSARKVVFHRVAENLYRLDSNGGYYALLKRGDKQFRRSLRTKDRKLAERRLTELRAQVGGLEIGDEAKQSFDEVAKRWMAITSHTLKASSATRRELCIRSLAPFFAGLSIRNIQRQHCERWLTERGQGLAPMTMNRELELMRSVFGYAVKLGLILKNPAEDLKRRKVVQAKIHIPSREQFKTLVATIRQSDGRTESIKKAQPGADLVELLAYSGCRLTEATSLRWRDADLTVSANTAGAAENSEFAVLGDAKSEIARIIELARLLSTELQGLDRYAIGSHCIIPADTRESSYATLSKILKIEYLNARSSADLLLRLNRPTSFVISGAEIRLNQVATWASLELRISTSPASGTPKQDPAIAYATFAELDFNTAPDQALSAQKISAGEILEKIRESIFATLDAGPIR